VRDRTRRRGRRVLELLRAELDQALALCGCRTPSSAGPDLVRLP